MVRDEVHQVPHGVLAQRGGELVVRRCASHFRIDLVVIADVVAVRAVRRGGEVRGRVTRVDTKLRQIGDELAGVGEAEVAMELQPVGAQRDADRSGHLGKRRHR